MGKTTKYIKQQTTTHKQPYNIKSKQASKQNLSNNQQQIKTTKQTHKTQTSQKTKHYNNK